MPGKSHGQRNLAGYGPGSHIESDTSERLNTCSPPCVTGELTCTNAISQAPLPLASRYVQSMGAPGGGWGGGGQKSEFSPFTSFLGGIFGHGCTSPVAAAPPEQPPVGGTKLEGSQQGSLENASADQPVVHGPEQIRRSTRPGSENKQRPAQRADLRLTSILFSLVGQRVTATLVQQRVDQVSGVALASKNAKRKRMWSQLLLSSVRIPALLPYLSLALGN